MCSIDIFNWILSIFIVWFEDSLIDSLFIVVELCILIFFFVFGFCLCWMLVIFFF